MYVVSIGSAIDVKGWVIRWASPLALLSFVRSAITSAISCWRSACHKQERERDELRNGANYAHAHEGERAWLPAASCCIESTSACSRSVVCTSWDGSCAWPDSICSTPRRSFVSAATSCSCSTWTCQ